MASGVDSAIATAARLDEIGFPEFTTKLVTDVFDALIASNLQQQKAYIELLQATAKSLKDFINDTRDDIGAPEIKWVNPLFFSDGRLLISLTKENSCLMNLKLMNITPAP